MDPCPSHPALLRSTHAQALPRAPQVSFSPPSQAASSGFSRLCSPPSSSAPASQAQRALPVLQLLLTPHVSDQILSSSALTPEKFLNQRRATKIGVSGTVAGQLREYIVKHGAL